ncbi:MAG: ester cyclase [Candidatus Hodarchaeota archaeon]
MKTSILLLLVLTTLIFCACTQKINIEEENKAVVRNWFEEGWNRHNPNVIDKYFAANYVNYGVATNNVDEWKQFVNSLLAAFPDIHYTLDDQIAEGDKVVTRWTAIATHQGEFMSIPATGKKVTFNGINISHHANGKYVEDWGGNMDALGLLEQLKTEKKDNPFVGKWNFFEQVSVDGEDATRESVGFDIYLQNGFYTHTWMLLDGPKLEGPPKTIDDYNSIIDFYHSHFGKYSFNLEDSTLTWANEGNLLPYRRNVPFTFKIKIVQDTLFYRFPGGKWIWKCKREH